MSGLRGAPLCQKRSESETGRIMIPSLCGAMGSCERFISFRRWDATRSAGVRPARVTVARGRLVESRQSRGGRAASPKNAQGLPHSDEDEDAR